MASGRKTLKQIERSIAEIRDDERELQEELEEANEKRTSLLEERTKAFRELAEVRARHAISDGVIDEADRLSHRVHAILAAREKTLASLKRRLATAESEHESLLNENNRLADEIAELEDELDRVATKARAELEHDPDYKARQAEVEELIATHDRAAEKSKQTDADRKRKGKAYENDPLFMYLWRREYGRDAYRAKGVIRWLDDWVARLVRYHESRANYAILLEIPRRLNDHVTRLAQNVEDAKSSRDELEAERIRHLAGKDLTQNLAEARNTQAQHHEQLEQRAAEITEITSALNRYAEGRDESFAQAVSMSAEFLEQERHNQLVRLARLTPGRTDDRIVGRISNIDRKVARLRDEVNERRHDLERLSKRKAELVRVAGDFRRSYYNEPGSVFMPDDDWQWLVGELIKGAITGAEYWSRARSRHRWKGRPADPFRKWSGFPPFGGGKRRGRRGGGGFSTGGGF